MVKAKKKKTIERKNEKIENYRAAPRCKISIKIRTIFNITSHQKFRVFANSVTITVNAKCNG